MKITFIRVKNSELPEPYPGLETDTLYLTSTGYVYPEGSNAPIDIFDAELFSKLSENKPTTIASNDKVKIADEFSTESFRNLIKKYKSLIRFMLDTKYASVKSCAEYLNSDKNVVKEHLNLLIKAKIVTRYQTSYTINKDMKLNIEYELAKEEKL